MGKTEDSGKIPHELFNRIKAAFNQAYVTDDGRIAGDTQTGYVLALKFDLVEGERAKLAAQHLVENIAKRDWHLSTGFIGTKDLMLVLSKIGRNDVAYRLIYNDTFLHRGGFQSNKARPVSGNAGTAGRRKKLISKIRDEFLRALFLWRGLSMDG